ncbi:hypothetical protein GCM10010495_38850 [Kitasatospora herbaricolor]|uniref:GNAT family N-acetyltransferase n=1 Tax=Kitasatospora herbaricolor TaxID=68217 RepID=UPI00174C42FB|nr:GNAT family N-acetyltransferase [Kitasatospora herbaricolor]MDQ0313290.1 RimJ/RimL family protein N-acetyltransferase [Kitasatospora herbaricolor]GGV19984.1 hypothetical protein GCM10010495_38850 [Kitasatospora herbaricolor]
MRLLSTLPVPTLTDGQVSIRRPEVDDAATLLAGSRDPLVREFMQGVIPHRDMAEARRWLAEVPGALWARDRAAYFSVVVGDGPSVGWAELVDLRPAEGAAEASIWLLPQARSLKVASSALRLICRFGFEGLGLCHIDAYAARDNMPVQVVGASIGFRRAGYRPGLFRSSRTQTLHDAVHATLQPQDLC